MGLETVYPRAYEAAGGCNDADHVGVGLSPRIRGSHGLCLLPLSSVGFIPVHTGQPGDRPSIVVITPVYPRAYGAAAKRRGYDHAEKGLSSRIRGSLDKVRPNFIYVGSIPTCAGYPLFDC